MHYFLKRWVDVTVAATLLVVAAPLLVALALLVRLRLGSPALFRQTRIGKGDRPFTLIKFRTMLAGDTPDEERLTPFGQWLRATSLDELPELWNILVGNMSLVGPRPLLPQYLPYYTAREATRHRMRPGITGLAQVSGRNTLSWDARLELDAQYIEQFSLLLDFKILWRTVMVVLKRDGINREGHVTMHALDVERAKQGTL